MSNVQTVVAALKPAAKWTHNPKKLRALLDERGLHPLDAAALIGVSARTFGYWLCDDKSVRRVAMPYTAWVALSVLSA